MWVTFLQTWYVTMAHMQGHMLQLRAIVYDQNLQVYEGSYGFERCELYLGSCDVKGCVVKQFVCSTKVEIMQMLLYLGKYSVFEMPQRQGKKVEAQQECIFGFFYQHVAYLQIMMKMSFFSRCRSFLLSRLDVWCRSFDVCKWLGGDSLL